MNAIISPSKLSGVVNAPPSKSSMQRACAAAWIRGGKCILQNPGKSEDDLVALDIIRALGSKVTDRGDVIEIETLERKFPRSIHCGESGLSARLFTPILGLSDKEIIVEGSGTLRHRPFQVFNEILPLLGVSFVSDKGHLPLRIKGPLMPRDIIVDGSVSSQFITGLIYAYVAAGADKQTIHVNELKSAPYVDLSIQVLRDFGLNAPENIQNRQFRFSSTETHEIPGPLEYRVESDWSGAAFLLVAGALAGSIMVRDLDLLSRQGDRAIIDIMMDASASIAIEAKGIRVHPLVMDPFETDATDFPDLFPPLVALATNCKGRSRIRGVQRLVHKESNRAETLRSEFSKLGVNISIENDVMTVEGTHEIRGAVVSARGDHRIAMALSVAALRAETPVTIEGAECVNKSFPDFFEKLRGLQASVTLSNE